MLPEVEEWIAERPAVRSALPWVSGAAVLLGLFLMMAALRGDGPATPLPPAATATGDLEKGLAAAMAFFEKRSPHTFEGFTPKAAEGIDASLTWTRSETAVEGQVAIRVAKDKNVLMVAADPTGIYCLYASSEGDIRKGTGDAVGSGDCTGGW